MKITFNDYTSEDASRLAQLFYDTVHNINASDYTLEQIEAWAPPIPNEIYRTETFERATPFIAEVEGVAVGFASIETNGYIDFFFVAHDWQGKGIGRALMEEIFRRAEEYNCDKLYSHVSITAKPFFLNFGFKVIKRQTVETNGVKMDNFIMERAAYPPQ